MSPETLVENVEAFVLQPVIVFLFALAFVVFFWGVAEFLINFESEDKRAQGKKHMLWGVIGVGIMLSAVGIFELIENTIYQGNPPEKPSDYLDY